MNYQPLRFINEAITPKFDTPPIYEKKPGCPDQFIWRDEEFQIVTILSEWHDYKQRGRMARNMRPGNASAAEQRGSWGVGQDYYRVETDKNRIFEIYYDRAPKDSDRRKGEWFLYREIKRED